jgi:hypothetical protein
MAGIGFSLKLASSFYAGFELNRDTGEIGGLVCAVKSLTGCLLTTNLEA